MGKNQAVDKFFESSELWSDELSTLRKVISDCKLSEELKWGKPCYCLDEANIVLIQAFKSYLALLFFKGALMKDSEKLLVRMGENTQAGRQMRFEDVAHIEKSKKVIKAYIQEAIALEQSGAKVEKKAPEAAAAVPDELTKAFSKQPALEKSFRALTPGRQRAYLIHFSGAKQSATRESRIDKCKAQILAGKGLNE